ncbi:MAG: hypothetical protein PWQ57_1742 [Desulfovibrionales bacterium]|nr:hypothetical protein [Desulfovibrionales bacterium]
MFFLAEPMGLEPTASGVTGQETEANNPADLFALFEELVVIPHEDAGGGRRLHESVEGRVYTFRHHPLHYLHKDG